MQPTQFCSFAVNIGNHPILFGALRYANTSTGQMLRQNPQALHMSSATTTSQRPVGPFGVFFSVLNSAIASPIGPRRGAGGQSEPAGRRVDQRKPPTAPAVPASAMAAPAAGNADV